MLRNKVLQIDSYNLFFFFNELFAFFISASHRFFSLHVQYMSSQLPPSPFIDLVVLHTQCRYELMTLQPILNQLHLEFTRLEQQKISLQVQLSLIENAINEKRIEMNLDLPSKKQAHAD